MHSINNIAKNPALLHFIPKPQPGDLFPEVKTGVGSVLLFPGGACRSGEKV